MTQPIYFHLACPLEPHFTFSRKMLKNSGVITAENYWAAIQDYVAHPNGSRAPVNPVSGGPLQSFKPLASRRCILGLMETRGRSHVEAEPLMCASQAPPDMQIANVSWLNQWPLRI